jgi:DEAD/DEAH box helicase domain-containing protein
MVHCSLLPFHENWKHFWKKLRYVVVDEIHVYSGTFGSHVGLIFRRIQRLLKRAYGRNERDLPRIIACSATIANPYEHAKNLFFIPDDRSLATIDCDGSPSGKKEFLVWDTQEESYLLQTARLTLFLTFQCRLRLIVFCKVRRTCELLMREIAVMSKENGVDDIENYIVSYRGGYQPTLRR